MMPLNRPKTSPTPVPIRKARAICRPFCAQRERYMAATMPLKVITPPMETSICLEMMVIAIPQETIISMEEFFRMFEMFCGLR